MSEKELLYVEDALSHLEYFKRHLCINKECLTEEKEVSLLKKIDKKVDLANKKFPESNTLVKPNQLQKTSLPSAIKQYISKIFL